MQVCEEYQKEINRKKDLESIYIDLAKSPNVKKTLCNQYKAKLCGGMLMASSLNILGAGIIE